MGSTLLCQMALNWEWSKKAWVLDTALMVWPFWGRLDGCWSLLRKLYKKYYLEGSIGGSTTQTLEPLHKCWANISVHFHGIFYWPVYMYLFMLSRIFKLRYTVLYKFLIPLLSCPALLCTPLDLFMHQNDTASLLSHRFFAFPLPAFSYYLYFTFLQFRLKTFSQSRNLLP